MLQKWTTAALQLSLLFASISPSRLFRAALRARCASVHYTRNASSFAHSLALLRVRYRSAISFNAFLHIAAPNIENRSDHCTSQLLALNFYLLHLDLRSFCILLCSFSARRASVRSHSWCFEFPSRTDNLPGLFSGIDFLFAKKDASLFVKSANS